MKGSRRFLETIATSLYEPLSEGEERPGLLAKVMVFFFLALIVGLGIAANREW